MRAGLFLSLLLLVACTPAIPATPTPASGWSVVTVAEALQGNGPVVWPSEDGFAAAWVGSDDAGVHHDTRRVTDGAPGPVVVLPLPPRHPFDQQGHVGLGGALHLLWLDASDSGEGNRLYSALLTPDLTVERGPTEISDRATLRYASVPGDDGTVWALWSGGQASEPALYLQQIDAAGRPRPAERVASDAAYPALTHAADGSLHLFWLGGDGSVYHRIRTPDGALTPPAALTTGVRLAPGDRLESFTAGLDSTHGYLFWNVARADGSRQTLWSSTPSDAPTWEPPRPLNLSAISGVETVATWVVPASGARENLVAVGAVEGLIFITFAAGAVESVEPIAATGALVGPPALTLHDGRLYAAWAEPGANRAARLNVAIK